MSRLRILLFVLVVAIGSGCGGRNGPTRAPREDAVVVLKANVRDAQLYVDGRFIGPLDAIGGGVAVAPGMHRFELRHEEYFSAYLELELAKSERKKLSVELAPVLP
jgi:hypothetical protein